MAGIWRQIHFSLLQHRGRIGRLRYIAFTVVLAAALLVTVLIGGALSRHIGNATGLVVGTALYLMTVFLSANLAVKRLHDLGFPGWRVTVLRSASASFSAPGPAPRTLTATVRRRGDRLA